MQNTFIDRLREICETVNTAEISRKLGIPYNTMKNYTDGRFPNAEILIQIAEKTDVNIYWLLTGKGEKFSGKKNVQSNHAEILPKEIEIEIPTFRLKVNLVQNENSEANCTEFTRENLNLSQQIFENQNNESANWKIDLRSCCEKRGIENANLLHKKLGGSKQTWYDLWRGNESMIRLETLNKLDVGFGIKPSEIFVNGTANSNQTTK